ncbi:MAG: SprB repeat-containing protein [Bacteroidetes bacterium]|nr:SprB repeat-containing protein [Bacteroidota bacterium]
MEFKSLLLKNWFSCFEPIGTNKSVAKSASQKQIISFSVFIILFTFSVSPVFSQTPCCVTGNQMPNGSFETETPGALWNTTFSGAEAMWMPKNVISQAQNPNNGWFVGTDVTVNEAAKIGGFYIRNNNGNGDPADGTHYTWVRGRDSSINNNVCMQIYLNNIGIAASCKRYELCFKAAAWNPDGPQGNAEIGIEWFYQTPGGAFPVLSQLLLAPANTSGSFNDLNWNTYTTVFEIPSNYGNFFGVAISSHENIDGICIDDVCIREVGVAQLACLPPSPFVSAQSAVTCNGGNNGCATIDNLNGGFPWAFLWNDGNTNGSRCGLSAGTYTVTVTDNTGATGTVNVTITQPSALVATCSHTDVTTNGGSDGTASVVASGGTGALTYLWSNGNSNATMSGLSVGTYTVTVTDANGCTQSCSALVVQPAVVPCCVTGNQMPNGSFETETPGALWNTTFSGAEAMWMPKNVISQAQNPNNGWFVGTDVTVNEAAKIGGFYIRNNNGNGDPADGTHFTWVRGRNESINNNVCMQIYLNNIGIAASCKRYELCFKAAAWTPDGPQGDAQIGIEWFYQTPGGAFPVLTQLLLAPANTSGSFNDLNWNTYTTVFEIPSNYGNFFGVAISSHENIDGVCIDDVCIKEVGPAQTACLPPSPFVSSQSNVTCSGGNNGCATIDNLNGGFPFTYLWSDGNTNASRCGLAAGTYTATVTDNTGATGTVNVTIAQPTLITATCSGTDVTTPGGSNGTASVTASGGTGALSYLWSNANTNASMSGLSAGTYTVTVTDANGCTQTCSTTILEPTCNITIGALVKDVICNGGADATIDVTVAGANGAISYLWNDGNTNEDRAGLSIGTFTVTVTDAANCTNTASFAISEPIILGMSAIPTNVSTNGGSDGSVNVTTSGGTSPYSFLWNDGDTNEDRTNLAAGTYTVTVTDDNGCTAILSVTLYEPLSVTCAGVDPSSVGANDGSVTTVVVGGLAGYTYIWSNGDTSNDLGAVAAGTYTVTVTDILGNTSTCQTTLVDPFGILCAGVDVTTNGGSDGSANVTATGGVSPFTYLWSNGSTGTVISGIGAGVYTITVTDNSNSTLSCIVTINEPTCNEVVSGLVIDVLCNGGTDASIDVTVTGNNGTVTYLWNDGDTNEDRTGLAAGTYTVTATDAAGCIETATFTVTEPALLGMSGTPTDVTTNGGNNGSIDVTATGGTPAYTYLWNDGDTNEDRSGLTAGTYTVTVTDANGCTEEATFTINEPGCNEVVSGLVIDVLCNGGTDASIDVTVTGNNGTVTYLWNDGDTNEDRTGLAAGTYTVTATDAAGCIETATFTVTEPALLGMSGTPTDVTTNGGNNGSIDVTATGGTPAYTYLWNDGDTNEDRSGLTAGTYTVTVTDANGCTEEDTFTINEPGCNEVVSGVVIDVLCNGGTDASIDLTVTATMAQ